MKKHNSVDRIETQEDHEVKTIRLKKSVEEKEKFENKVTEQNDEPYKESSEPLKSKKAFGIGFISGIILNFIVKILLTKLKKLK